MFKTKKATLFPSPLDGRGPGVGVNKTDFILIQSPYHLDPLPPCLRRIFDRGGEYMVMIILLLITKVFSNSV